MPDSNDVKRYVVEKIEFVNVSITGSFTNKESATFKKISSGCAESVTKKIASCSCDLNVPDAIQILTHLHESHLLADDKEKIARAINGKAIEAFDQVFTGSATHTQTIPIEKYLVQRAWDFILSDTTVEARISFLGDLCRGLGVFNPSENTSAEIASLAFIGHVIKPSDVWHVRQLKRWLKNKNRNAHFIKGPNVYPDNPEELKETHPQIWDTMYKEQPPVECPIDHKTIKINMADMPRRCTRSGSNASSDKRRCITPALSSERDVVSLLANVLQRKLSDPSLGTPERGCSGLRVLGENQKPDTMLAIEDKTRSPTIEDKAHSPTIEMPPPPKPLLENKTKTSVTNYGVDDMISQMKSQLGKKTFVTDADETESEDGNSSDGKKVGVKSGVKKRPASARLARSDIKKTKATTKKKAGRMEETVRMQGHIDSKLNNRYAPAPVEINSNNLSTLR